MPSVETVENRFVAVNDSRTTIDSTVAVHNPNPIGVTLGDLGVSYAIDMKHVRMATGRRDGIALGTGTDSLSFQTVLPNERIPAWLDTHVNNGEVTNVLIDVTLSHGLFGGDAFEVAQTETVETDLLDQFTSTETRPIDAEAPTSRPRYCT